MYMHMQVFDPAECTWMRPASQTISHEYGQHVLDDIEWCQWWAHHYTWVIPGMIHMNTRCDCCCGGK